MDEQTGWRYAAGPIRGLGALFTLATHDPVARAVAPATVDP